MASLSYLVLYLYLHAFAARPLMVRDKETAIQLQLSSKDVKKSSVAGRFIKHDDKAVDHDTNVMQLDEQKFSSIFKKAEKDEGKKLKTTYSWKILQKTAGTEPWKRADQSMLESSPSDAEENVCSKITTRWKT